MSTDLCVSAYPGGGTWREEAQSHTFTHPRSSTSTAFPSGTTAKILAASSTNTLDHHEYLKSSSRVLPRSVWGGVVEKEQRFNGTQPRITRSTYARRRSLSGTVIQKGRKEKVLGNKKFVKNLECHDSQTTVEVVEKHTEPQKPEPNEVGDEDEAQDSSTIICAIDTRLEGNTTDNGERFDKSSAVRNPSGSPLTTINSFSSTTELARSHSPKSSSMSSISPRHSSSPSSSTSTQKRHLSPPALRSSEPTSPSKSSPKHDKSDTHRDDKDDWHQIHEPEQRRRIQNRIAQRKFREKARSMKDQQARDAQNKKYAGCAYTCPEVDDLPLETYPEIFPDNAGVMDYRGVEDGNDESARKGADTWLGGESGLPWGGLSMRYMIGRGHEYYRYQTSRGSGSGSGSGTATITSLSPTITALGPPTPLPTGTSGGDSWPSLQRSRAAMDYRHMTSAGSTGSPLSPYGMMPMGMDLTSGGDMDVDYTMVSGAGGRVDTGMEYVTSPPVSMAGVSSSTGMDVTYYDSSPYYYGYGNGGVGGDAASGSGGSVYGGHGARL